MTHFSVTNFVRRASRCLILLHVARQLLADDPAQLAGTAAHHRRTTPAAAMRRETRRLRGTTRGGVSLGPLPRHRAREPGQLAGGAHTQARSAAVWAHPRGARQCPGGLVSVSSRLSMADGLAAELAVVNDGEQGTGRAARGLLEVVQAEPAGGRATKHSGGPTAWDDHVGARHCGRGPVERDARAGPVNPRQRHLQASRAGAGELGLHRVRTVIAACPGGAGR
jgi:hypothetical protein